MFTPQQIDQISFSKATFGGYNMEDVDQFLEPLTEDYITLYKENALLKSKMKVLVSKLEEYRNNEASMRDAIVNAQKTCDKMVKEAEAKCAKMLGEANAAAVQNARNNDALIQAENARVEEARRLAHARIEDLEDQLRSCLTALERIKENHKPAAAKNAFDYERVETATRATSTDAVADEISASLQALVGTTDDEPPIAEAKHPVSDTTGKFDRLMFGPNYNPTEK